MNEENNIICEICGTEVSKLTLNYVCWPLCNTCANNKFAEFREIGNLCQRIEEKQKSILYQQKGSARTPEEVQNEIHELQQEGWRIDYEQERYILKNGTREGMPTIDHSETSKRFEELRQELKDAQGASSNIEELKQEIRDLRDQVIPMVEEYENKYSKYDGSVSPYYHLNFLTVV